MLTQSSVNNFSYMMKNKKNYLPVCMSRRLKVVNRAVLEKCPRWILNFQKFHQCDQIHYVHVSPNQQYGWPLRRHHRLCVTN